LPSWTSAIGVLLADGSELNEWQLLAEAAVQRLNGERRNLVDTYRGDHGLEADMQRCFSDS
jgi:hypothetical protein